MARWIAYLRLPEQSDVTLPAGDNEPREVARLAFWRLSHLGDEHIRHGENAADNDKERAIRRIVGGKWLTAQPTMQHARRHAIGSMAQLGLS